MRLNAFPTRVILSKAKDLALGLCQGTLRDASLCSA